MATREIHAVSADGTRVTATEQGRRRGATILIVHPGSSDASSWEDVAAKLSDRFRVVRIHRRLYVAGHPPPAGHSMATEVEDLLAISAVVDGPRVLVGHSSGAVVALESALAAPETFAGMLLYEPPVAVTRPLGGQALRRARAALDAGDPGPPTFAGAWTRWPACCPACCPWRSFVATGTRHTSPRRPRWRG